MGIWAMEDFSQHLLNIHYALQAKLSTFTSEHWTISTFFEERNEVLQIVKG